MTSTTLSIRLPVEVSDKLSRIAASTRRSRSFLAAEALAAWVDRELAIIEGIEQGLADAAAERLVPRAQVRAEARAIIEQVRRDIAGRS
ncbi:MAG: ribbon-helix-helix protein, CopG family [Sphingomonadales bacterium]|nr:ribbon-helix-helix protein, CopG family [Sphingomonadales bacterium]